ncbi:MAG: hypothetical protein ABS81_07570 [Pseudonocardia sp. SCN 72-86]|nr:MAG: hypothetical protein ABS81_07570 [Pseudonocardia sp. SCN 72-86]
MSAPERTVLHDVRVFDGHQLGEPTTDVIAGTRIESVGSAVHVTAEHEVDAGGATLLPGLIDADVHLRDPQDLLTLASWGVTTGLDMACWPVERVATLRTADGGADFRSAGLPAIGPDGNHARMPGMPEDAVVRTPTSRRRPGGPRAATPARGT